MSWNYRVVRSGNGDLTIREVHYKQTEIIGMSQVGEAVQGETIEELHEALHRMSEALVKPILKEDYIIEQAPTGRRIGDVP